MRQRLPNRRYCETFEFDFEGIRYTASYGRYPDSRIGELFLSAGKAGSKAEADACGFSTAVSISLQHGVKPSSLAHSMVRNPDGSAGSAYTFVMDDMVKG